MVLAPEEQAEARVQRRLRLLRERERAQPRELGEAPGTRLEVDDERHKSLDKGWATALGTGARRGWEREAPSQKSCATSAMWANPHVVVMAQLLAELHCCRQCSSAMHMHSRKSGRR